MMICAICKTNITETTDPYVVIRFVTDRRPIKGEVVREMHNSAENAYCSQLCAYKQISEGIDEFL